MSGAEIKPWIKRRAHLLGSVTRTTSPQIVLTYDDGPDPHWTPGILECLARHGATATFFVLLTRTRKHPQLVREIVSAGHEVALHGVDHQRLTDFGFSAARKRTSEAKVELEDLSGVDVRWFRPPYGRQSLSTWAAVRSVGLTPVLWSATTWDWKEVSQDERVVEAVRGGGAGSIVLAHDGFADAGDAAFDGPPPTFDRVKLLERLLEEFSERSLSCLSLGKALE